MAAGITPTAITLVSGALKELNNLAQGDWGRHALKGQYNLA